MSRRRPGNPLKLEFLRPGEDVRDVYVEPTQERLKSVSAQIAQAKMNLKLLNRQIPDSMTNTTRMELLTEFLDVLDLVNAVGVRIKGDLE